MRRTPDDNRAAALAKIARIQASIHALGMEDTEELQILQESLKKADNAAKIPLPQVQIDHALEYIKRARKRLESADDKIAKAVQALRFAEEEKESDMKGIAESEALIKRLREEVEQNLLAGPPGESGKTETSFREMLHLHGGHRSSSSCANRLHSYGGGSHKRSGTQQETPPRGLHPDVHGRSCPVDGRPSERFAGGHVIQENPRCHKIGAVGRRRWSTVEDVDGRKSPLYGRQFSEHGAMSAAWERPLF